MTSLPRHRKREYCSNECKQLAYRKRREKQLISNLRQLQTRNQELESQVRFLEARLSVAKHVQADTKVRHFKAYLRTHPHPLDFDFFQRFLADTRLPQHGSRALYEAKLRAYGYQAEDIHLFRDAWLTMLLE